MQLTLKAKAVKCRHLILTPISTASMAIYTQSNECNQLKLSSSLFTAAAIISLISVGLCTSNQAYAANSNNLTQVSPATNQQKPAWLNSTEQQQLWQESLQQQRIESLRQSQQVDNNQNSSTAATSDTVSAEQESVQATDSDSASQKCLPIQRIELGAMPELSSVIQEKLRTQAEHISKTSSSSYNGQHQGCVTVSDANVLARSITAAYLEAGFFKISIEPSAANQQGISTWQVYVAKIKQIDNKTELPTARLFGKAIDTPLNMAQLDQAVSQGERIIDGQLLLDIYPVANDVRIEVNQLGAVDTLSADVEWQYDPDDSYGHHQLKLHGTLRNIFGQAELTSLSLQQSLTDKYGYDEDNQRRSASIYSIIPNGRWQWSALLAADEYKRSTPLAKSVLQQTGDSWQANIRADYTLQRDQDSITTLYGQVSHHDVNSEILGSRLDVQSPTLSSGRLGASYTKLFNNRDSASPHKVVSGVWVVDLSAEQGFGNHDNPATDQGLQDDYLRWLLSGYVSHQHSIATTDSNLGYWQMTHELQGQYSDDRLFGVTQQGLGSTYTGVRGIANTYNAAESGLSLRNTLSFEPRQSSWQNLGKQQVRWSPYIGIDYGVLKDSDHSLSDDTSEAYSGTLGIKLTGYNQQQHQLDRKWQLDVSASRADVDYNNQQVDGWQDTEIAARWQWYF